MAPRTSSIRAGAVAAIAAAVALTALTVTGPTPAAAQAQPTTPTTITPPPAPAIVPANGFLLRKGRFTTMDPPGSVRTKPTAISNRGQILFKYLDAAGTPLGAVRDPRGRYRTIDVPGAAQTSLFSINRHGQIAGGYQDTAGAIHGFVRERDGRYRTVDVPGAAVTLVLRLNDRGQLVGSYSAVNSFPPIPSRGFLLDHGVLTRLDVPGARETSANGLNNLGEVVGGYIDATGAIRGFLRDRGGRYRTIDAPRAAAAGAADINDRRQIVGSAEPTIATPPAPQQSAARAGGPLISR